MRRKPRVDGRHLIDRIVHRLTSGRRWKGAPEADGPQETRHKRFVRKVPKGAWVDMFYAEARAGGRPRRS